MKNIVFLSAIFFSAFTASATSGSQNFEMKYEVVKASAVCWATCRHGGCEESDFAVFFDVKTYSKLASLKAEGKTWRANGLKCEDDITFVNEHMLLLQQKNPKAAAKIMAEKGTEVDILIYTDVSSQATGFINQLLSDLAK